MERPSSIYLATRVGALALAPEPVAAEAKFKIETIKIPSKSAEISAVTT